MTYTTTQQSRRTFLSSSASRAAIVALAIALLAVCTPAWSRYHDDSTPQGLRITITSVDNISGTVYFDVTMIDQDNGYYTTGNNGKGFLGQRFYYENSYGDSYSTVVFEATSLPPALDFGDSSTVPYTQLDFYSATGSGLPRRGDSPTVAQGLTTFKGSFSHTYSTPGVYLIRAFTPSASGNGYISSNDPTTGNNVGTSATVTAVNLASTSTITEVTSTEPYGITNTAQVTVDIGQGVLEIPTAGGWGLLLLGLALGAGGLAVLRLGR